MERRRSGPDVDNLTSSTSSRAENIVQPELDWRSPPPTFTLISGRPLRIAISRWRVRRRERVEVASDTDDDCHVLSIALRRTRKELFIGGKSVWLGGVRDEMLLTGPKRGVWRATVEGGCDFLRVFLPQTLIAECYAEAFGGGPSDTISMFGVLPVTDLRLRQLGQTFKALDGYDPIAGPCFADSLGLAVGLRLVELACGAEEALANGKLARPQITRVVSYIEDNLAQALCLLELSEVAGLSRVQFVRQFKQATGQPPHAYILQRRIERAKALLKNSDSTIVGVALDLGFCNQNHFARVFSKTVGMTPGRWRSLQS
ncbi:helix-turn-helix domain-containing protein [Bradyrhizobium sp. McL0616]|uniref:helix-turn-helix domain-containing protein n=1 Tax=Bradyrhizobium sp. McL0616 TaxID=3415674 RepID=UPI003CEDDAC4